jgi:ribA/ribD-fused uncharacterized protein
MSKKTVQPSDRKLRSMPEKDTDMSQDSMEQAIEEAPGIDTTNMDPGQLEIMKYLKFLNSTVEKLVTGTSVLEQRVVELECQIKQNDETIESHRARLCDVEEKYNSLLEKQLYLDSYNRKENLVFHGVAQKPNENCAAEIRHIMKTVMKIPNADAIKIQRCHRLPSRGQNAPIICRFLCFDDREAVWAKKVALKGSKIFVSENFAPEIEDRRQMLYPILKEAKKRKLKAIIKYDKIVVEGKMYSTDMLHSLPPTLRPENLATTTRNNITCFFTGASPLSNFHVIKGGFQIDGKTYDCVERFYQLQRAAFAEKLDMVDKIRNARGPLQCKILGDSIQLNENEWFPTARQVMLTACRAKFRQHEPSRNFLLGTGDSELAEAGPNKLWGIGLKKEHPDAFVPNNWQGKNTLGEILKSVREEIKYMTFS